MKEEAALIFLISLRWLTANALLSPGAKGLINGFNPYPMTNDEFPRRVIVSMRESSTPSSWGVADDWSSLSLEGDGSGYLSKSLYSPGDDALVDPAAAAAREMEEAAYDNVSGNNDCRDEDLRFLDAVIDSIQIDADPSDPPLYDTPSSLEYYTRSERFLDEAEREISLLVRCNKEPESLLVEEGRALAPIGEEERHHISQLVVVTRKDCTSPGDDDNGIEAEPTAFFNKAVQKIFQEHSGADAVSKKRVIDRGGLARWMTKSLKGKEKVTRHDKRISVVISRYSTYGTGYLTLPQFRKLYLDAVLTGLKVRADGLVSSTRLKQPTVRSVWRDFAAHGILSPVEMERQKRQDEIDATRAESVFPTNDNLMDECEILEWEQDNATPDWSIDSPGVKKQRRSSHELVELASDSKTPKRMIDGQFVFIDEESCIGCMQCAMISPDSFIMLDNGRARTFRQRNSPDVANAVSACPVNCMHHVGFDELKEMETFRDKGDGRTDHRHMGRRAGHTPLFVAGIDSDNNHKSSWYHYLKSKCLMSANCPSRGCYDCPKYSSKGANPFFKKKRNEARRMRVQDLIESGEADKYRKFAVL